ncbi:Immunoglobulin superfamily member 5 [Merluccius polli]|nr:Immunoglobulin superfamily member 5 [Merluccius polli]
MAWLPFFPPVASELQLKPLNPAVLLGSNVSFTATELLVLTINRDTGALPSAPRYQARNISTNDRSAWEFSIVNVTHDDSGPIVCTIQGLTGARHSQPLERGTVDIVTGNLTVKHGKEAEFRCEASGLPTVSWWLDGVAANTTLYNTTSQTQGTLSNSTSVLRVQAVRDTAVQCRAALAAATVSRSVYLVVVPDWTVLIAVVVSFGGAALLVLLIIGIIFCCRWKKEKGKGGRGVEVQHSRKRDQLTWDLQWMIKEGETASVDSGLSPSIHEIPSEYQNQTSAHGSTEVYALQFTKHRHATIV